MPEITTLYCPRCLTTFQGERESCSNLGCARQKPATGWGRLMVPGEIFDRNYRIERMLALGGAGVTYVAHELDDEAKEEAVALKVLFSSWDEGTYLQRLATEAQVIQALDHPNIIRYLGFVHRKGRAPYLITRFEPEGSLLDRINGLGLLGFDEAISMGRQLCRALLEAHAKGVVHRDLKPENLLVSSPPGEPLHVRVADFGIAKMAAGLGSNMTRVGIFIGTPHYAAPEQFRGEAATAMVDVYSTGALLYFCLTGERIVDLADRLPLEDSLELLLARLPPTVGHLGLSATQEEGLNAVLARCMHPNPAQRCSMGQLSQLLAELWDGLELDELMDEPTMERPAAVARAPSLPTMEQSSAWTRTSGKKVGAAESPRVGRWVFAVVAIVVCLGMVGGWAGMQLWQRHGVMGDPAAGPAFESAGLDLVEPVRRRDAEAIWASLEALKPWLAVECGLEPGGVADVRVVVEGGGAVRSAEVMGDRARCVAAGVKMATMSRTRDVAMEAEISLRW